VTTLTSAHKATVGLQNMFQVELYPMTPVILHCDRNVFVAITSLCDSKASSILSEQCFLAVLCCVGMVSLGCLALGSERASNVIKCYVKLAAVLARVALSHN
jgi:hypothetical protein